MARRMKSVFHASNAFCFSATETTTGLMRGTGTGGVMAAALICADD